MYLEVGRKPENPEETQLRVTLAHDQTKDPRAVKKQAIKHLLNNMYTVNVPKGKA